MFIAQPTTQGFGLSGSQSVTEAEKTAVTQAEAALSVVSHQDGKSEVRESWSSGEQPYVELKMSSAI